MLLNGAVVHWYSKHQNTVESSTFGFEFAALNIAMEVNSAMCCKLHMMGVPITGPSYILDDNQGVVWNVTNPVSQLTKHIAYHKCCEEVAAGAALLAFKPGKENCSNGLTKILAGQAFQKFFQQSCIMLVTPFWLHNPSSTGMGDSKLFYV